MSHQRIEYRQVPSNLVPAKSSKVALMNATYMTQYAHIFDPNKFRYLYLRGDIDNGRLMRE